MFDAIDEDGNGRITIDELEKLMVTLNQKATKTQLEALFKVSDKDGMQMLHS